jgi:glycosyltransferase involved in cell wall biosynthesis
MTIGMPVVALATTELPAVIQHGETGLISNDFDELLDGMRMLLARPDEAARIGANARRVALERFGLARFGADWNAAFGWALRLRPPTQVSETPAPALAAGS